MKEFVKVFSTSNDIQLELIKNLLLNNNIDCYVKEAGSGQYMKLYMGVSFFEKDIYVEKNDYEKSTELIKSIKESDEEADTDNIQENDTNVYDNKNYQIGRRIILLIIIMIIIGIPLLAVCASLLQTWFNL